MALPTDASVAYKQPGLSALPPSYSQIGPCVPASLIRKSWDSAPEPISGSIHTSLEPTAVRPVITRDEPSRVVKPSVFIVPAVVDVPPYVHT